MKHPALVKIRGLIIVLEQSKDTERNLEAIKEIVSYLRAINKDLLLLQEQNKARFQSPR